MCEVCWDVWCEIDDGEPFGSGDIKGNEPEFWYETKFEIENPPPDEQNQPSEFLQWERKRDEYVERMVNE
jgi:hypothetical protein